MAVCRHFPARFREPGERFGERAQAGTSGADREGLWRKIMTIELKVPAVGESITEVEIGDWLKAEGAAVAKDEPVAVIETEKATVEGPCRRRVCW